MERQILSQKEARLRARRILMLITCYLFTVAMYINLMDHRTLRINRLNLLGCNILTLQKIPKHTQSIIKSVNLGVL